MVGAESFEVPSYPRPSGPIFQEKGSEEAVAKGKESTDHDIYPPSEPQNLCRPSPSFPTMP
jgi:hypothetical protein